MGGERARSLSVKRVDAVDMRCGRRAQYFACPGVRGNGIASRTFWSPVT
jgi:hypothetical protein